jgi:hypothetical protein
MDSRILADNWLESRFDSLCDFAINEKWKLLYRASEHGFLAKNFHTKCDHKTNTLTIIRSHMGYVFGGYAHAPWTSDENFLFSFVSTSGVVKDKQAFLFSLINKENEPIKMNILESEECKASHFSFSPKYGPTFGAGDLVIADSANENEHSFLNLGRSFQHPRYTYGSNEAKSFLAGSPFFKVEEIEIFQKI